MRRKATYLGSLLVLVLVVCIAFSGCASSGSKATQTPPPQNTQQVQEPQQTPQEPETLTKLNLGCIQTTGSVLYFVAQEEGFFKEEGLEPEIFFFTNAGEGINALIAGKLDFCAFGTAPPLNFISKGVDIVMFGGHAGEGHAVVAMPEKAQQLKTMEDYKGKTVATVRMATGDVVWRYGLSQAGIDWKNDVTINELESPSAVIAAVKDGSVDAGVIWSPFRTMAEGQGMEIVLQSGDVHGMEGHTCCRQIALREYLDANPELSGKFMRAIIKAYDFFQSNHDKTIDDIEKYVQIDREVIDIETYGPHINDYPDPNSNAINHFWNAMLEIGYIESDININDHINIKIYENALNELLQEYPDNANYKELKELFAKNNNV